MRRIAVKGSTVPDMDVFCLEGNWDARYLDSGQSLRPLFDLVAAHQDIAFVHRGVATLRELEYYLDRWADPAHRDFELGFFAFHGSDSRALLLDDQELTLRRFGSLLAKHGAGRNCVIHLASCYGLRVRDDADLQDFLEQTQALAVSGYGEKVDMLRAAALECLLMRELVGDWRFAGVRFRRFTNAYQSLVDALDFKYAVAEA